MKVLVVGGGGREAAICRQLSASPRVEALYCAPGNAGIARFAELIPITATDLDGLCACALREGFDLVVVAPDDPLALGLVDRLQALGIRAFGPSAAAARIESSKAFAKALMKKRGIPTAACAVFEDYAAAKAHLDRSALPIVVKADGLALGKGVFVCRTRAEAEAALKSLMLEENYGRAGRRVLLEECLEGPELTLMAFCDGTDYKLLPNSRDHKRAYDGDAGPNTGGMGVISPGEVFTAQALAEIESRIVRPTLEEMAESGYPFKGVLYFGLMLTREGPKVIEYNARFGDPEAETVLPLLESDLLEIFEAVVDGRLAALEPRWRAAASCCVVLASEGYPGAYRKGLKISGLEAAEAKGAQVFHAGTAWSEAEQAFVTAGGRVLALVAQGATVEEARARVYEAIGEVRFEGMHYRRDIGAARKDGL